MSDGLNLLISTLKYIDLDKTIYTNNGHYSSDNPLVNVAKYLANEFLIGDDGHPDRDKMDIIVSAGFPIFPGEQDRFGWLTAYIELDRGVIMFG
jgi:hypothetical protein